MDDLREYLRILSNLPGEMLTTDVKVSPKLELTNVVYRLQREGRSPSLLFRNVDGGTMPVLTNLLATRKRMAAALGCPENGLNRHYREKEGQAIQPALADDAPVQQVVRRGDEIDLGVLPIVTHNTEDGGPYITAGIMTVRDPATGIRNAGVYRLMVKSRNTLAVHLSETSHVYYIHKKYCERSQDMPVAITIGMHPAAYIRSVSRCGIDVDEYDVMGGLLGRPLPIVRCRTVDLEVPAYGEICLEGYVDKETRIPEGPFAEWASLYGGLVANPLVKLTAITMRQDPIYMDICSGTTEHQQLGSLSRLGQIFARARQAAPGVKDVYMPPSGFGRNSCYVAIKKMVEGEAANVAAAIFGADSLVRHVVVVDDDVNLFDDGDVLRAIHLYMKQENCFVISNAKGSPIDPSSRNGLVTKIGIDATKPLSSKTRKIDFSVADAVDLKRYFG